MVNDCKLKVVGLYTSPPVSPSESIGHGNKSVVMVMTILLFLASFFAVKGYVCVLCLVVALCGETLCTASVLLLLCSK